MPDEEPAGQRHANSSIARSAVGAAAAFEKSELARHLPRPRQLSATSLCDAFYPKAVTYVLSALEPVGKVPD